MSIFERTLPFASAGGKNIWISCFRWTSLFPFVLAEFVQSRDEEYKRDIQKL